MATAMALVTGASARQRCSIIITALFSCGCVFWHQRWSAVVCFLMALVYFSVALDV
jgi:hypothetical protein